MLRIDAQIMAARLVLKQADGDEASARPASAIGQWWENYSKPFLASWQQMRGDKAKGVAGDFTGAVSNLWQQRPGTLMGLLGTLFGGALGSTSDDSGASARWAPILGGLGLGGGYLWGQRNNPAIGEYIKKQMQPTIADAAAKFKAEMDPIRKQMDQFGGVTRIANWVSPPPRNRHLWQRLGRRGNGSD